MDIKFHLALPCSDLGATRDFYSEVVGAQMGRQAETWLDVDLFGNQLTFTQCGPFHFDYKSYRLDGEVLPAFHFGAIVPFGIWEEIRIRANAQGSEPIPWATFRKDRPGEHLSFFIQDPNGYRVEFKSFKDGREVFSN